MDDSKTLSAIQKIIRNYLPDKNFQIFLFGSRASGFARRFSDFDIGITGKTRVPPTKLELIQSDLEDSDIPYKVEVVDFAGVDESFKNLALKQTRPLN